MRSRSSVLGSAGLATLLALSLIGCSSGSDGGDGGGSESYKFKFATYNSPAAVEAQASQWWAKEIEERTSGRVEIEFFYQEALLAGTEILSGVGDRRADMGYVADAYYPAELPLTTVAGLPFVLEDPILQSEVFTHMYEANDDFRHEWEANNVHVLTWAPTTPVGINTAEPADSLEDLRNTKIRTIGYLAEAISQVGMTPVALSQAEVYEAIQRGVISGSTVSLDVIRDRDFDEVAPYLLDTGTGLFAVTANVINEDLWESLPQDIQDVLTEVSAEYPAVYESLLEEREVEACQEFLDAGGEVRVLSDSERDEWRDTSAEQSQKDWVDSVSRYVDAQAAQSYLDEYLSVVDDLQTDYENAMLRCYQEQ